MNSSTNSSSHAQRGRRKISLLLALSLVSALQAQSGAGASSFTGLSSPQRVPGRRLALPAVPDGLEKLKVADLKDRLREEGLKVSGKKAELVLRLQEHLAAKVGQREEAKEEAEAESKPRRAGLESLSVAELKDRLREADLEVSGKKAELVLRLRRHSHVPLLLDEEPEDYALALGSSSSMKHGLLPSWGDARQLIEDATSLVASEGTLEEVQTPPGGHLNVIGDVHGQYYDVLGIFEQFGNPSDTNPYLFNGDFVDRGRFSVEVMLLLLAWKVAFPSHFRLGRGNHETYINAWYGFKKEVLRKYGKHGEEAYDAFQKLFTHLPLAHVVNRDVFVCHGGLPKPGTSLDDIRSIDRVAEGSTCKVMDDLLWADPQEGLGYKKSYTRGGDTTCFGPDITQEFLRASGLKLLIRSHEVQDEGFLWQHEGKCLTVFSAPNYCGRVGNKGAVARLTFQADGSLQELVSVITFGGQGT